MPNSFDIHSLHGQYFSATIGFTDVMGRISVNEAGMVFLCQDDMIGGGGSCRDFFGYKGAFYLHDIPEAPAVVFNLKLLPSPTEYHALFQEILEKRGPTWSEDGSYSVIPNEVLAKIQSFLEGIKEFDVKNLGNNQNQL